MNIQASVVALLIGAGIVTSMTYVVKSQINARVVAELAANTQEIRANQGELQILRIERQLADERDLQAQLSKELRAARDVEAHATEVLEDRARLDTLTQAKPGLVERLAKRATKRVWIEIEADSRE
jgi:hypothetical protein